MRLIDADELIEHAWRDKLDSRELIVKMIENAPTIEEIPTKIPIHIFKHLLGLAESEVESKEEDIAKAFQIGLAFGFGEKHDEMDRVIDEIKKATTQQPKYCPLAKETNKEESEEESDDKKYQIEEVTRGNCMICGKELDEGLFICKECEAKAEREG